MLGKLLHRFGYWLCKEELQQQRANVRSVAGRFGCSFYAEILPRTERCRQCRNLVMLLVQLEDTTACYECWLNMVMQAAGRGIEAGSHAN
jgi:hypothetical protein